MNGFRGAVRGFRAIDGQTRTVAKGCRRMKAGLHGGGSGDDRVHPPFVLGFTHLVAEDSYVLVT